MQSHNGTAAIIDRLPPQNLDAEQAVLGSLLIDQAAIHEVSVFLKPDHFYRVSNRWVYEAILFLGDHEEPVDLITVSDELRSKGRLEEIGGESFIVGLVNSVPTSINAASYAKIVEGMAIRRGMITSASTIAKLAYDVEGDLDIQLATADNTLMSIRTGRTVDEPPRPRAYAKEWSNRIDRLREKEAPLLGLPSPWTDINRMLLGFIPKRVYYVGARPGMGKSSMLINLATHWAIDLGKRVFFWSGEMDINQILDRTAADKTQVPLVKIRQGNLDDREHSKITRLAGMVGDASLIIDETAAITPSKLKATCNREYMKGGLDAIMVDYIGLMTPDRFLGNQNAELTEVSKALVGLARTLNVPVIAASQLSRDVEKRADKRPTLSDLRDSGSLEQDGYAVMFLYRDDYYNEMSLVPNQAEVIVAKHREGPTGTAKLYWNSQLTAFRNLAKQEIRL